MDIFTQEDLERLVQTRSDLCLSLYMPTERVGKQIQQNPTRFKNLLARAESRLANDYGLKPAGIGAFLKPLVKLVSDTEYWRHQSDGLAMFLTDDGLLYEYSLPLRFDETVILADRFHIKPLLPILSSGGQFYVLALSQNEVRLLQGTRHTVDSVELEDLPESLEEALWYDDAERHVQRHAGSGREGAFSSHGVVDEGMNKAQIRQYFREVDRAVCDFLGESSAPLVLAAVDYLHPIYKEVNSHPHLVEEGIPGNPEAWSEDELHTLAWPIVQPIFEAERRQAAEAYRRLASKGSTSNDTEEIVPAAYYGRVDTLFVRRGEQLWGRFDAENSELEVHGSKQNGDYELLDLAAVRTLMNGGTVYAVEADEMPDDTSLAAVLRY